MSGRRRRRWAPEQWNVIGPGATYLNYFGTADVPGADAGVTALSRANSIMQTEHAAEHPCKLTYFSDEARRGGIRAAELTAILAAPAPVAELVDAQG